MDLSNVAVYALCVYAWGMPMSIKHVHFYRAADSGTGLYVTETWPLFRTVQLSLWYLSLVYRSLRALNFIECQQVSSANGDKKGICILQGALQVWRDDNEREKASMPKR
jgi:hypothetical protein